MKTILDGKTVKIITLGCKVNKYESDAMLLLLENAGCHEAAEGEKADISIVNTCSVTNIADHKSRQMLHRMKKENPDTVVVAAGCYVQAAAEALEKDESIDILIGNNRKKDVVRILTEYFEGTAPADNIPDINHDDQFEALSVSAPVDSTRAYIKIQDGCNLFCTYCIIPYVRGRIRSKSIKDIIDELNTLSQNGVREAVLTGINICSYNDEGRDFLELLREISKAHHMDRIRLGSLEPRIINDEFISIIKSDPRFCPHFHLSLQSVCDNTLKRMNRHYTVEDIKKAVTLLRENFDRPALTADIIAGFAGETEEDFLTTLDNLAEIKLYETHVFKYSRRKGTVADKMPDQLTEKVKAARSDKLIRLGELNKAAYEQQFIGEPVNVLVEEIIEKNGRSFFRGHTERYMLIDIDCKEYLMSDLKKYINTIITVEHHI
ncbi:MAG: tRNA (N(6)-L-threonylcarbamoyladenosine(37)-C(2))-methylthiotransferase MtaB [Eubacterium sp.]|nr:tRNA (N(6)-L-threonylcarbamoyladenosine(37)-C(2))-methylthiotransferase MtaB [Eubacterium sp.]